MQPMGTAMGPLPDPCGYEDLLVSRGRHPVLSSKPGELQVHVEPSRAPHIYDF